MKLFHLLGCTKELVFDSSASVIRLYLFFVWFLDGSRFFKEPIGIVCHAFEAFSRGSILLEFEMTSFVSIIVFFLWTFF